MAKRLAIIALAVIMTFGVFGLAACEKEPGFRVGYNYVAGEERSSVLAVAAKSDKMVFDLDDFTLEFNYGWYNYDFYDVPQIKYVLYFYRRIDVDYVMWQFNQYDISNNVDKAVFVKEILADEFLTQKYEFKTSRKHGKEFNFGEKFTIPLSLFTNYVEGGFGEIIFMLAEIHYTEDMFYTAVETLGISIPYQFVDKNTIKIKA